MQLQREASQELFITGTPKGLASVMSVSMISTTNDYTSMTSEGMVCDDACQTINLKDGQKVTEVYVTKDQQVKAGDKLLAYDVTSLSLFG